MDKKLHASVRKAVRIFWATRTAQSKSQGSASGQRDVGGRSAVTGGKHLDGFIEVCRKTCRDAGLPAAHIYWKSQKELPGYYRAEKNWDLVVVDRGKLLAVVEFKAQVGPSFGNNLNNRSEEAIGNAADLWAAYREGAFAPSPKPWLGYVFLLEDCPKAKSPVRVKAPHFDVFGEFEQASYADRYQILLTKLLRERLYDGACLLLSDRQKGVRGDYHCPSAELSFEAFAAGLSAHIAAHARIS